MSEQAQVEFTFDASGFSAAMNKIISGMTSIEKKIKSGAGTFEKHIGGALLKFNVMWSVLTHAFSGLSNIMNIPEIGQTFDIAKNIIMKNLLWPLRKELIPILNQVLKWVTDNRILFVQLGSVLVNVFRMVKALFTTILTLLKPILDVIKEEMKSIFGDTAKSISETLNMIILKITATIIYIQGVLAPLFEGIAKVLSSTIGLIKKFVSGFVEGFRDMAGGMNPIKSLADLLTTIAEALKIVGPLMHFLGKIVGVEIAGAFRVATDYTRAFVDMLHGKINKTAISDIGDVMKQMGKSFILGSLDMAGDYKKMIGGEQVDDAIITKDGKVIKTNPNDNIFASKSSSGMGGPSITFGNIYVTSTEGNAFSTGQKVVMGIEHQIRNVLLNNRVLQGAQ